MFCLNLSFLLMSLSISTGLLGMTEWLFSLCWASPILVMKVLLHGKHLNLFFAWVWALRCRFRWYLVVKVAAHFLQVNPDWTKFSFPDKTTFRLSAPFSLIVLLAVNVSGFLIMLFSTLFRTLFLPSVIFLRIFWLIPCVCESVFILRLYEWG